MGITHYGAHHYVRTWALLCCCVALVLTACGGGGGGDAVVDGGSLPAGGGSTGGDNTGGLFQKTHAWNTDVSALKKSARSNAIITALGASGGWGNGNKFQIDFSIPIFFADASTPKKTIIAPSAGYCFNGPDCEAVPLQMPVPVNANIEGATSLTCDISSYDCHMLVVDRSQNKLYEIYSATAVGASIAAVGAFSWDLTKQYTEVLRGEQCTSADAAGLPIAALLPTADEVAAGEIQHALRFILPNSRMKKDVYVHPATHAGSPSSLNTDAPPYGVRFRLKPDFNETPYNANARIVIKALKKYGMILSDGGDIALTFADDRTSTAKWAALGITAQTFNAIGVGNFEVVGLGTEIVQTNNCVRAP
jgi:hypothetical protein